jgi:diadenylate cyclase
MMGQYLFSVGDLYIRFWDIIDVLIIALLIYRAVILIKGTLAVQILAGLSILFVILKVSEQYELVTVHRLLTQFWQNWVILTIVLFQPEIRRALAQMGRQWSTLRRRSKHNPMIEELANAAEAMAKSRIGALIIIEREDGLANIREMGMKLDAEVSSELLRTIFYPHSPLHDGAVVIHDKRIAAAACFLPLTKNPLMARSLGTRHRAAIGITEESDAVAIIVSEERGSISLAINASLTKMQNSEQLKSNLGRLLEKSRFKLEKDEF